MKNLGKFHMKNPDDPQQDSRSCLKPRKAHFRLYYILSYYILYIVYYSIFLKALRGLQSEQVRSGVRRSNRRCDIPYHRLHGLKRYRTTLQQ